jgi:hypothetical protein
VIYTKTITRAAGGSAGSPVQDKMTVTLGLIYQFELYLPPGSSGLLGVMVKDGGYQVWPSEPGEWFFGNDNLIAFPDRYYISSPAHVLDVLSYNEDDTFPHTFQVRIGQVSDPALISGFMPGVSMDRLSSVLSDLLAAQDMSYAAQRARIVASIEAVEAGA